MAGNVRQNIDASGSSAFAAYFKGQQLIFWTAISVCIMLTSFFPAGVDAASFQLSEFTSISRAEADAISPGISSSFSAGRFSVSGINSVNQVIKIIRVEGDQYCISKFCPMIVVHSSSDWKVMIKARAEAIVENPSTDFLQIIFKQKNGSVIIRFAPGQKMVYISQ